MAKSKRPLTADNKTADQAAPTAAVVEQPMVAPAPKKGDRLTRGGTSSGRVGQIVSAANRWRENYNPLRGLTMRRAVELLELGQRGDMAYLQWTFRTMERRGYPTLGALLTRCESPIENFGWEIKVKEEMPTLPGMSAKQVQKLAEAQKTTLKVAYDQVDNLKAAILHLHLAEFRGYAHLQKHRDEAGEVYHLETLNQWCVCRDGLEGNWWWNPDSKSTSAPRQFLGMDFCIGGPALPLDDFIIHEAPRPIDEVALVLLVRANLAEKDADGFLEIYGIPGGVVIMPGNVPQGKESEYEAAAQKVAEGGSGAIPNGADYKANDGPRGVDPFTPRLKHVDEQLILAGTGGKLTMLAESGSGTLAGGAHSDTFEDIAEARGQRISERFQREFDAEVLDRKHPGEPVLVYFTLTSSDRDSAETTSFKREVVKGLATHEILSRVLANQIDIKETVRDTGVPVNEEYSDPYVPVAETTGAMVTGDMVLDADGDVIGAKTEGGAPPATPNGPLTTEPEPEPDGEEELPEGGTPNLKNRASDAANNAIATAAGEDLSHVLERLQAISEIEDDTIFERRLGQFLADFPKLQSDVLKDSATERALLPMLMKAFLEGLSKGAKGGGQGAKSKL